MQKAIWNLFAGHYHETNVNSIKLPNVYMAVVIRVKDQNVFAFLSTHTCMSLLVLDSQNLNSILDAARSDPTLFVRPQQGARVLNSKGTLNFTSSSAGDSPVH